MPEIAVHALCRVQKRGGRPGGRHRRGDLAADEPGLPDARDDHAAPLAANQFARRARRFRRARGAVSAECIALDAARRAAALENRTRSWVDARSLPLPGYVSVRPPWPIRRAP